MRTRRARRSILLGPLNEWGEGSYIEPYAEYGFQDLDQVREAFCEPGDWPPNLIPSDVGLGPYDLPSVVATTAWEFATSGGLEGWMSNGDVAELEAKDGLLLGRSTGRDPVLQVPGIQVEASRLHRLTFRLRSQPQPARAGLLGDDTHGDERGRVTGHRSGR